MTISFNMATVRFRKQGAHTVKVPNRFSVPHVISEGSRKHRRRNSARWNYLSLEAKHDSIWEEKMEISSYLGTKVGQAQVWKGFNRPPRRAAQLCWSPWILHIPHFAPLTSATCNPSHTPPGALSWPHVDLSDFHFFLKLLWRRQTLTE